ncbi:hypothetical protein EST38_g14606 [Candolleomyces aberdarensis]|uniref:Uncharacterized protein n=1 Tax=Candolleomyces aberdarensis TaxID=2316362 RepID=A0A4Q2CXV2_9AGAR|nr:hypothetical protein EST38_g14606 [Candolleomyces aberdarensis]
MEEFRVERTPDGRTWFKYDDARALLQVTRRTLVKLGIQLVDVPNVTGPAIIDPNRRYSSSFVRAMQGARVDSASGDAELYLPRLESLDLVVDNRQTYSLPKLYQALRLPSLRTLSYAHRQANSISPSQCGPHPLCTILSSQRHPIAITTLIIDAGSISRAMLLTCIRLLPLLERLWVQDSRRFPVEGSISTGDTEEEIVPDDTFLADLLPTFCYDIPVEFSWDFDLLCPLLTHIRFDRAWFTLDGLKNFVNTRLSLAAVGAAYADNSIDYWDAVHVAKLKSVHVGFAYQMLGESDQAAFGYELRESNVTVSMSFPKQPEAAVTAEPFGAANPREGLREIDEWL